MALASSILTTAFCNPQPYHRCSSVCRIPFAKANRFSVLAMASETQVSLNEEIKGVVTRQLWRAECAGRISDLKLVQEELASPSIGEVQVTIKAIGLNFADVFTCLGLYSATPRGSYTPGLEFAGVVRAVGIGVDTRLIGENVFGLTRFGAYTSHINVSYKYIRKFPDSWSFAEAASFPVQGLTMMYALRDLGNVHEGQIVLIHSAAGGCGTFGLGICKKLNAKVIATVGHEHKVQYLVDHWGEEFLPPKRIIIRKGGGKIFQDQLRIALSSLGAQTVDCIIDAIQGDYFQGGYDMLSRGGRYIAYGASSFTPHGDRPNWISLAWKYICRPMLDPLKMMEQNKSLMAFNLIWMFDKLKLLERLIEELESMDLKPPIVGRKFPFSQVHEALSVYQSGTTTGKVILEI